MSGRRIAASLVCVLMAAGALAACTGTEASNARVTYWAVNMGPTLEENQRLLKRELATFTEKTGIEVDLEILGWDVLYTRIMTAVGSGRGPDVVNVGNTWSATLQDTGAFLPIDGDAMAAIGGRDKFLATTLTATGATGLPPASIPFLGQTYGLYYNTEMFAEAGITEPPRTWAEFVADAKALTKPGQWGVSLIGASAGGNAQLAFLLGRQHGAQLFTPDGEAQFDTAAQRAGVRRLIDLMAKDRVVNPSDAEKNGPTDALAALADGRAAMVLSQSSGRGYLGSVDFDDYAVAPLPLVDPLPSGGAPVQSFVAGTNLAVFDDTGHRDEALELVRFLTSDAEQAVFNKAFGTLPVVHGAYDDPAFQDPVTAMFGEILSDRSETMPMVPAEGQMEQLLGGAISKLWADAATGKVTDEEIASSLADAEKQMPR
jgi:multiple sugar transport system substrate-binding protein